jgi:hypothetical protein
VCIALVFPDGCATMLVELLQVSSSKIRVSFAGSRQDQLVIGLADPLFIS